MAEQEPVSLDRMVESEGFRRGVADNLCGKEFADTWSDVPRVMLAYEFGRLMAAKHGPLITRMSHRDLVHTLLGMLQNGEING